MSRTTRDYSSWDCWHDSEKWRNSMDRKKWYKPGKIFKRVQTQRRKAQERMVMKNDLIKRDPDELTFPNHRRENQWLWN